MVTEFLEPMTVSPGDGRGIRHLAEGEAGPVFEFHFYSKRTQFGDIELDQFWMPVGTIYGQRKRRAVNREAIINCFWACCQADGSTTDPGIQEVYWLARLLPKVRSNGSRQIVRDSVPSSTQHRRLHLKTWQCELEDLLMRARDRGYEGKTFSRKTRALIGPPRYSDRDRRRYLDMCGDLFHDARIAVEQGRDGFAEVLRHWKCLDRSIGRRRGNDADKEVLNVLSYEAKAAMHRCYSAVWSGIIPELAAKYHQGETWQRFHNFWNCYPCWQSNDNPVEYEYLFHGHVFSLHPGCGPLLLTPTGCELVGE